MAPVSSTRPQQPVSDDLILRMGFVAMAILVFCSISRLLEYTVPFLPIPMILTLIYLAVQAVTGRLFGFLSYSSGKLMLGF